LFVEGRNRDSNSQIRIEFEISQVVASALIGNYAAGAVKVTEILTEILRANFGRWSNHPKEIGANFRGPWILKQYVLIDQDRSSDGLVGPASRNLNEYISQD
jgi:hypothetical protein